MPSKGIAQDSKFAATVHEIMSNEKPMQIIETGTWEGLGSTSIILGSMPVGARFISLESNPDSYAKAVKNLQGQPVELVRALSIPRRMMPTGPALRYYLSQFRDLPISHDRKTLDEEVTAYEREAGWKDIPDNGLFKAFETLHWKPDFILLDSAGHLGYFEFMVVMALLGDHPCILALDDVNHPKHYLSSRMAKSSSIFKLIAEDSEKTGFAIFRYIGNANPETSVSPETRKPVQPKA